MSKKKLDREPEQHLPWFDDIDRKLCPVWPAPNELRDPGKHRWMHSAARPNNVVECSACKRLALLAPPEEDT